MREGLQKVVSADETIVAISTPLGRSGIGIVRMSGQDAFAISKRFFRPHSRFSELEHKTAVVGMWTNASGDPIDEVVVTAYQSPRTYTGENVVEISAHGNPFILGRIVETARAAGARTAMPGEFTLRALAHGKLDLVQAEAVREFIAAQTDRQAKAARRQMEGSISNRIRPIRENLVDVIARLEAGIDFAEDDVEVPQDMAVASTVRELASTLERLQETFGYGRLLTEGLGLAIVGKPNVGKSSLFNRLVAADRAIVTEIPGTTRDVLTETVSMDGIPLRFADTAGVRQTADRVESLGVGRTLEALADADFVLVVLDGSSVLDEDDRQVLSKADTLPHLIVINKTDLPLVLDNDSLNGAPRVQVSAKTGKGFDELRDALRAFLFHQKSEGADDLVLTNARQYDAITEAISGLHAAGAALTQSVPHEMVLLDLYRSLSAIGELTGEVVTDDILARIFSTFCIGK